MNNNQQFQIDPMERLASSKREFGEFGGANASIEVSNQHNKDAFPQFHFPSHLSLLNHRSLTLTAAPLLSHSHTGLYNLHSPPRHHSPRHLCGQTRPPRRLLPLWKVFQPLSGPSWQATSLSGRHRGSILHCLRNVCNLSLHPQRLQLWRPHSCI